MLRLPDDPTAYRIVGIDPGTDNLGVSVLDVDLRTGSVTLISSQTLTASRMINGWHRISDLHGARFSRLQVLGNALVEIFVEYDPHAIISETPYFNKKRPDAFGALVEALSMIRGAVYRFCSSMALLKVDPAKNKANLGVSGKSSDKELVKRAVMGLSDLHNPYQINLALLDEHSIDSLAVAWFHACYIRSQLL